MELQLFRHAKSRWDEPGLADRDRGLAPRGVAAATRMGRYFDDCAVRPAVVLCSPARRARATLELAAGPWSADAEIREVEGLYMAEPRAIADILRGVGARAPVMVIGHNPGLEDFAKLIVGDGDSEAIAALTVKFPTAALALITLDAASWSDLGVGRARLERFVAPRRLD